jgi:uncharacterized phage protein (TIGR02220 family)
VRSRNVKPGFFKNEDLSALPAHARLLFAGLWCLADRAGRLEDRPARIRAELFPYDETVTTPLLNGYLTDLERIGLVVRYEVGGRGLIEIVSWARHQHPHHTEKHSEFPPSNHKDAKKNGGITVKEPEISRHTPSDSLIPDSLIPDSSPSLRSGGVCEKTSELPENPTPSQETPGRGRPRRNGFSPDAYAILEFLNQRTGKNFRLVDVNLRLIDARLSSGVTPDVVRAVIVRKWREWKDRPDMHRYLRPETLFGATKFEQYVGEVPSETVVAEGGANGAH